MRKRVSNYFLGIVVVFSGYLIAISIIGHSEEVTPYFYYGFWLVLGIALGFRLCVYLYEKGLNDQSKKGEFFNKEELEKQGRLN